MTDNGTLAFNRSDALTFDKTINGSGSVVQTGAGTLILTGSNSYGSTTISSGTLQVGNGGTVGTLGQGAVVDNASLVFNRSNSAIVSNAISGTGSVTQVGSGTLILTGSNNYGTTTISGGTLQVGNGGVAGTLGAGAVTDNTSLIFNRSDSLTAANTIGGTGSVIQVGSGLLILNGSNSYAGGTTITSGTVRAGNVNALPQGKAVTDNGTLDLTAVASQTIGGLSGNGAVSLASSGTLTVGADNASALFSGSVGGSLASFTKTGAGDQTLSGNNTYTGTTTVNGGRLIITGQSSSGSFVAGTGGTLRLDGDTINLTSGSLRANTGGAIEYNNATVNGGFLRGPGTHTILPGTTASFAGVTSFNTTNMIQNGTANLTNFTNGGQITNGAVLNWDGGSNTASGRLTVNSTVNVLDWSNDGIMTISSAGVLNNSGSDLISSGGSQITVNNGGQVNLMDSTLLDLQGGVLVNSGVINGPTNIGYGATARGTGGTFGPLAVLNGGTLDLSASNTTLGTLSGSGGAQITASTIGSATLAVSQATDDTYAGVIQNGNGVVALTKSGPAMLILAGSNSYSGGTTISSGTLQVGNGGAAGTLGSGAVADNGVLVFNRSDSSTVANAISGSGSVTQAGSGTTILTGSNSYGATTISSGTLQVGNGGTAGTLGSGGVTDNGALVFHRSDSATVVNTISGNGSVTQAGLGTTILSGSNTYTGPTNVTVGKLFVNGDQSSATGNVTVAAAATLGGSGIIGGAVNASGSIAPGNSIGTLTTGNETWNGGASYLCEINSFPGGTSTASAGLNPGWDLLSINGGLTIASSTNSKFTIKPISLSLSNETSVAENFFSTKPYQLTLATATGGITGFNAGAFAVDTSGFMNDVNGGTFQVATSGTNNLQLDFTPQTTGQTYSVWASGFGLTGGDADANADPDHDGIQNLVEYALGSDPLNPDADAMPVMSIITVNQVKYLALTYARPLGNYRPIDVTYFVERSTDVTAPNSWSTSGVILHSLTSSVLTGLETVVMRSAYPIADREFLRFKVTKN